MDQDIKRQIKEIIGKLECPLDFKCIKPGGDQVCKAKEFGLKEYVECLEEHPVDCGFSVAYGNGHFCHCPLRVYICKKLGK
jgi:hypothetical protein